MRGQCRLQPYGMSEQLLHGARSAALALADLRKREDDVEGSKHWLAVAERLTFANGTASAINIPSQIEPSLALGSSPPTMHNS